VSLTDDETEISTFQIEKLEMYAIIIMGYRLSDQLNTISHSRILFVVWIYIVVFRSHVVYIETFQLVGFYWRMPADCTKQTPAALTR